MRDLIRGMEFGVGVFFVFSFLIAFVYAIGWHDPSDIVPGNFEGDYYFNGSVNFSSSTNITGISADTVSSGKFSDRYVFSNQSSIKVSGNATVSGLFPTGMITSFYLTSCPDGWKAADGTNGTPDLRGQFIRGLNDFGTGLRSDGREDPSGMRSLGDWQSDLFGSHSHGVPRSLGSGIHSDTVQWVDEDSYDGSAVGTHSAGGTETRPQNVALIYCMKK